jgi:methyltransferase (TIGR00027 family)
VSAPGNPPDRSEPDVGETAVGAALLRARESARPDGLFHDAWAHAFVTSAPPLFADGPADSPEIEALAAAFQTQVAVRTRHYDDVVLDGCRGGIRQVVLLGAGLDARAFRLDWPPGARVFELDLPGVLAFKQRVLDDHGARPRCERTAVPVDLAADWPAALVAAGFQAASPTTWTAEGLLAYLDSADAGALLAAVSRLSAPGSRLAVENASLTDDALLGRARDLLAEDGIDLWRGGLGGDAAAWLRDLGWDVRVEAGEAIAAALGRHGAGTSGVFVTAVRPG